MRTKSVAILSLLLAAPITEAQQSRELLQSVRQDQARRLEEYNHVFLQKQLYFASRHRIVKADVDVLLEERDITVTPFEDVEPIRLIHESMRRIGDDHVFWTGRIDFNDDALFRLAGIGVPGDVSMHAWDLDESGNALVSSQNRFEFPPNWIFDEFGNVISAGDGVFGTLPLEPTPERIERHRRLQRLDKRAFYSVSAVLHAPGRSQYSLQPLQYTPRYSVIYEIAPGTIIPFRSDVTPGEPDARTPSEIAIFNQYRAFMDSLPNEEGKAIRGDIERIGPVP